MTINRIVSFLPSATELIYALDAQDRLFGVTHECDFPKDASKKPNVIESVFEPKKMSSKEIDGKVLDLISNNQDLYYEDQFVESQQVYEYCVEVANDCGSSIWSCDDGFTQPDKKRFKEKQFSKI